MAVCRRLKLMCFGLCEKANYETIWSSSLSWYYSQSGTAHLWAYHSYCWGNSFVPWNTSLQLWMLVWMRLSFVGGISSLSIKIMMKVVKSEIYGQQEAITPWMSKRRLCTIGLDCSHIACDEWKKIVPLGGEVRLAIADVSWWVIIFDTSWEASWSVCAINFHRPLPRMNDWNFHESRKQHCYYYLMQPLLPLSVEQITWLTKSQKHHDIIIIIIIIHSWSFGSIIFVGSPRLWCHNNDSRVFQSWWFDTDRREQQQRWFHHDNWRLCPSATSLGCHERPRHGWTIHVIHYHC